MSTACLAASSRSKPGEHVELSRHDLRHLQHGGHRGEHGVPPHACGEAALTAASLVDGAPVESQQLPPPGVVWRVASGSRRMPQSWVKESVLARRRIVPAGAPKASENDEMDTSQPEQVILDPNAMAKAAGSKYFQLGAWVVRGTNPHVHAEASARATVPCACLWLGERPPRRRIPRSVGLRQHAFMLQRANTAPRRDVPRCCFAANDSGVSARGL